jgi:hypothetical protein
MFTAEQAVSYGKVQSPSEMLREISEADNGSASYVCEGERRYCARP